MKKIPTLPVLCSVMFSMAGCRMEIPQFSMPSGSSAAVRASIEDIPFESTYRIYG